jgi:hypothetical protein
MAHQTRRAPADRDAPYRALDRIVLLYALKSASRDRLRERHSTGADVAGPDDRAVSAAVLPRARALVLVWLRRLFGYPSPTDSSPPNHRSERTTFSCGLGRPAGSRTTCLRSGPPSPNMYCVCASPADHSSEAPNSCWARELARIVNSTRHRPIPPTGDRQPHRRIVSSQTRSKAEESPASRWSMTATASEPSSRPSSTPWWFNRPPSVPPDHARPESVPALVNRRGGAADDAYCEESQ